MKKISIFLLVVALICCHLRKANAQNQPGVSLLSGKIEMFKFSSELRVKFRCHWKHYYSMKDLTPDSNKTEQPETEFGIIIGHMSDSTVYLEIDDATSCGNLQIQITNQVHRFTGKNESEGEFRACFCPPTTPCFSFSVPLDKQKEFEKELAKLNLLIDRSKNRSEVK